MLRDSNRLLSKLTHRAAVYTPVHEDSSAASTLKAAGRVEVWKEVE